MYYKRSTGKILVQKTADSPSWVKWTHHSEGKSHCDECLKLDGCFFTENKHPTWPHHPFCHCTLDPIEYSVVLINSYSNCAYGKFDPYLFDPNNFYKHGKDKMFRSWGYSESDISFLIAEFEKQAHDKYIAGEYTLGRLNKDGQRISIRIELPRRDQEGTVSFETGWMVYSNGHIQLTTPYGGK